jgi:hypothetical protein
MLVVAVVVVQFPASYRKQSKFGADAEGRVGVKGWKI